MHPVSIRIFLSVLLMLLPCTLLASMQFSPLAQQHADAPLISYDIKQDPKGISGLPVNWMVCNVLMATS